VFNLIKTYFPLPVITTLLACLVLWLISLYYLLSNRHSFRGKVILLGLIIGITTNIMLFRNPLFYLYASKHLNASDIGFRQYDALSIELDRFKRHAPARYLAVGSSQTGAIYTEYHNKNAPRFSIFAMAGLGPLDFLLYRDIIKSRCSSTIILTLSDFDLARKPHLEWAKLSSQQGMGSFENYLFLYKYLYAGHHLYFSNSELLDVILANTLDPYRLQFVFRGFVDKVFSRNKAFPEKDETALTDKEMLEKQLKGLLNLDKQWIDINMTLVDHFITWADKNNLKVVIVEGHYHPGALKSNLLLHKKTSSELEFMCARHKNARFIQSNSIYEFTEADYRDGYHVRPEIGYKFSLKLMNILSKTGL
jgi:hypothetical protein